MKPSKILLTLFLVTLALAPVMLSGTITAVSGAGPVSTVNFTIPDLQAGVQIESIPGYTCYRTVEETYSSAAAIAAARPDLVEWNDVGDSWEKTTTGGQPGYDMMVLKLTNSAIHGSKPRIFITAAIHGYEYATAELVMRFGEYLVNNYGVDADATWLLDYHEVHLMMFINPDGRKKAETGLAWLKNTDNNYCADTSNRGINLNRNFSFQWGQWGGSSGSQCNEFYRGPTAASEPETQAVQSYMWAIFPDQRAEPLTSPAAADATGVYLDVHSNLAMVYWPWGFTYTAASNSTALQTLGRKLAFFNGYLPTSSSAGRALADGMTSDFAYGDLGVAAFLMELGGALSEPCTAFVNTDLPLNLPALIYAAKVARTPYLTPLGPDALSLAVSPASIAIGDPTTLTATINDTLYNNTNGREATQNIAAAEYYIDIPPWQTGAVANAMSASDGSFSATTEGVMAKVNTFSLSAGRHILFVRGMDASNNWGAFSAVFLSLSGPALYPSTVFLPFVLY